MPTYGRLADNRTRYTEMTIELISVRYLLPPLYIGSCFCVDSPTNDASTDATDRSARRIPFSQGGRVLDGCHLQMAVGSDRKAKRTSLQETREVDQATA